MSRMLHRQSIAKAGPDVKLGTTHVMHHGHPHGARLRRELSVKPSISHFARGGLEGTYRSSLDAREPQNPTKSEEYRRHLQGVLCSTRGAHTSKTLVTNVVNTQDSQGLAGV
eukprot:242351-Prorocentrum_minimum.AAC.2